jgi:hypothetical protein
MATVWFICPYEVVEHAAGPYRFTRELAVKRHIRFKTSEVSVSETETLGNNAIVQVTAPDNSFAALRADAALVEIGDPAQPMPAPRRAAVRVKMLALDFTPAEFDACADVAVRADGTVEIRTGRLPPAKGLPK